MCFLFPAWRGLSLDPHISTAKKIRDRVISRDLSIATVSPNYKNATVNDLTVITTYYGNDDSRAQAANNATQKWGKSTPLPKIILVEGLFPGDIPNQWPSFIEVIQVNLPERSRGVWLKETLLDIAIKKYFIDTNSTDNLLLLDVDSVFVDPSWAVMVSDALSQYDVIHPSIFLYGTSGSPVMDFIPEGDDFRIYNSFPPFCAIGMTSTIVRALGKLPKDQWRNGDSLLIDRVRKWGVRYGTGYQTIVHLAHSRNECKLGLDRKYYNRYNKYLLPEMAIDWSAEIPIWIDDGALEIVLEDS